MKLCPQCDFIYEDDQRFCDMDGTELVHDPAPVITETAVSTQASLSSPNLPVPLARRRWRSFAVAAVVVVVLATLVSAVYIARTRQTRLRVATKSPERAIDRSEVRSTPDFGQTSPADTSLSEPSREKLPEPSVSPAAATTPASSPATSQSAPSRTSLAHTRLTASPVSAGGPGGNSRGPVIVRLNNGAVIKANESWERKEGIWYRQAGVVTFLSRSRVRTIERPAPPTAPSKSATNSAEEKRQNTIVRDQLRLAQLEPVDTKKQSRIASFLKKTGRILKRPFKL